jgi:hypothetical protein
MINFFIYMIIINYKNQKSIFANLFLDILDIL